MSGGRRALCEKAIGEFPVSGAVESFRNADEENNSFRFETRSVGEERARAKSTSLKLCVLSAFVLKKRTFAQLNAK